MPVTVLSIITRALNLAGRLGPGRTAGPSETTAALSRLNEMLDAWGAEPLMVYQIVTATYSLAAAQQIYQIGPSALHFNTTRPVRIEEANIIYCNQRYQLKLLTPQEWSAVKDSHIAETGLTGVIPRELWNNQASPISSLYLWPIPSTNDTQIELFTWQPIAEFASTSVNVTLPPAYLEALRFNLAASFAAEVGKGAPPQVMAQAAESKRNIQLANKAIFSEYVKESEIEALAAANLGIGPRQSAPPVTGNAGNSAS
jgi:hypothetical protein